MTAFRFSLAELLVLTTAMAVLAVEAKAVGVTPIAFAVLATFSAFLPSNPNGTKDATSRPAIHTGF